MLNFVLKGIGIHFTRIIASFPIKAVTGHQIGSMVWSIVRALWLSGVVVKAISSDGASVNHNFFLQNASEPGNMVEGTRVPYKCLHPYDLEEEIFFVQDACHVIKVQRNNLANSGDHDNTRTIKKNEKDLSWAHIRLVAANEANCRLQKLRLTPRHLNLESYFKMNVRAAAVTMSGKMASAMEKLDEQMYPDTRLMSETTKFIRYCNRFFDLCNVRSADSDTSLSESRRTGNTDLAPYRSLDDPRLAFFQEFQAGIFTLVPPYETFRSMFQDYLYYWHTENWRQYGIGNYDNFLSSQCYKATMQNTAAIPAFIRWALGAGYAYVLTGILETDDVEAVNAQLRQAGGDRRNPSVQGVLDAIPILNLTKQTQKLIRLPRGANVDPSHLADPALSSQAVLARRLADPTPLPTRPAPSAPLFAPSFFIGRFYSFQDFEGIPSNEELSAAFAPVLDKTTRKRQNKSGFLAELFFTTATQLVISRTGEVKKGKVVEKKAEFVIKKPNFISVASSSEVWLHHISLK